MLALQQLDILLLEDLHWVIDILLVVEQYLQLKVMHYFWVFFLDFEPAFPPEAVPLDLVGALNDVPALLVEHAVEPPKVRSVAPLDFKFLSFINFVSYSKASLHKESHFKDLFQFLVNDRICYVKSWFEGP